MRTRFILALLILLLACALQFWFASAGVFVNFILAALIVFAFFFDVWELVVFVLAAVLIVNWEPAISLDIIVFALIPPAAFIFHKTFAFAPWIAMPASIVAGFAVLYLAIAPASFGARAGLFGTDVLGGLVFAALVFATLERLGRA